MVNQTGEKEVGVLAHLKLQNSYIAHVNQSHPKNTWFAYVQIGFAQHDGAHFLKLFQNVRVFTHLRFCTGLGNNTSTFRGERLLKSKRT